MDSFESLVASILEREGFWVRSNFKVDLTKEEKRTIGRPSSPRWEIDLLAIILAEARMWAKDNRERILAEWYELNRR
jgi:hypothetical protein